MIKCSKCGGHTAGLVRAGRKMHYCRLCQLPHDEKGVPLFDGPSLAQAFNPLKAASDFVKKANPETKGPARSALEAMMLQTILDAYFNGVKDGILLAYNQDVNEGEPMEKLGVSTEELRKELQDKYNELIIKQNSGLAKEASVRVEAEIEAVKSKLDEISGK